MTEYYSAIIKEENFTLSTVWEDLENIIPSEIMIPSQPETDK